ncbi:hypothetical protein [Micromonospora sp. NBC_00860]|nr:hypothetical protein OH804_15995 [Micromonospora sp. NBC_00860]
MADNFDLVFGNWTLKQWRLREVLAGGDEWYGFFGTTQALVVA